MIDQAAVAARCIDAALAVILEKETELGQLDAAAGDGDHGAGMARGFRAAAAADRNGSAGQILANAGMAFANSAGGASGALVGTFITMVGTALQSGEIDAQKIHLALNKGIEAIAKLGKAQVGDKTMLDTLVPFANAFGEASASGANISSAWQQALPAARTGMESTKEMISKRGRSSVLKERSLGIADPGATSCYYILAAVGEILTIECQSL